MLPAAYEAAKPDKKFDVIIFDRYQPKFMPDAGNFVYFGAVPPEQQRSPAMPPVYAPQPPAKTKGGRHHRLEAGSPDLAASGAGQVMRFADPIKLTVPPEAEVLMEGPSGPLMVLYHDKFTTDFVMAFDIIRSTWPLKPSFPVFMHNLMQFLAVGSEMDVRPQFEPGATPRIQRCSFSVRLARTQSRFNCLGRWGRKVVPIPPQGDFALPPLDRAGVYATCSTGAALRKDRGESAGFQRKQPDAGYAAPGRPW